MEINSRRGVITEFCSAYAKNMLRHNKLYVFPTIKIGPLHSYYYIGEKPGFFSRSLSARAQLVMPREWCCGQPSLATMLRAVRTPRQKTSRSGDLFFVSVAHWFSYPRARPRGGAMAVRAIPTVCGRTSGFNQSLPFRWRRRSAAAVVRRSCVSRLSPSTPPCATALP